MKKSHPQINMLVLCTQTIIPLLIFPSVYNYIQNEHIVNKQEKYNEKPGITLKLNIGTKAYQKQFKSNRGTSLEWFRLHDILQMSPLP